jgi:hypothetical protein
MRDLQKSDTALPSQSGGLKFEVPASATPFLAGCRKLLNLGYDPRQRAVMRHLGADHDALSATIGAAAKLTVEDDGAPRFRRWKSFLPREGSPPIAQNDRAAIPASEPARPGVDGARDMGALA